MIKGEGTYRIRGVSLLELMVVMAVIAALLAVVARQMLVWNGEYGWNKALTVVERNSAMLLAAASVYYYANCQKTLSIGTNLTCADLVAAGGFTSDAQCEQALQNPWGNGLNVQIVQQSTSHYLLQVTGDFSAFPVNNGTLTQLAQVLNAEYSGTGNALTWTRLPDNTVVNQGVWYRTPGGMLPVNNANETGGARFSSIMWIMKAGLGQFAASQKQQNPDIRTASCSD
jgi:prepilin-type N-terminal cleavage/methylation domain-containing protein